MSQNFFYGDDARTCPPLPACSPLLSVDRRVSSLAELSRVHVALAGGSKPEASRKNLKYPVSITEIRYELRQR
jgi:hypothetical protein